MSALDMVLQRQVPARPAARAGDGMSGGNGGDGPKADAFSAALSNEKRSSALDRGKVQSSAEAEAGNEAADADEHVASQSEQSDDILNLLAGLKSSATYPDDAELGAAGNREDLASELLNQATEVDGEPVEVSADATDEDPALSNPAASSVSASGNEIAPAVKVANKADVDDVARNTADQVSAGVAAARAAVATQASDAKVGQTLADAKAVAITPPTQVSAGVAATRSAAAPQASDAKVGQTLADAKAVATTPSTQVATAAAGLAGQNASAQPKAQATSAGTDQQKDPSALKEAMRALGLEGEPAPANADAGKTQARGRNSGGQGGADDKRIDELTSKKEGKVEVIESRRFTPAQNLSANAQMLTRSLAEASSNAVAAQRAAPTQALAQTGTPQAGQTLHTLKLQLNPVSLGSVTAVLKLSGDDLSVEIKVQTAEAYRQIKQDNEAILKSLRGQGFGVEQITVQHVVGTDRASGQTAQQGFQAGQQGPEANDAQSSGRDGNNAGQQQSGSRGGQSHEQSSYAGPGAGRADGVYL